MTQKKNRIERSAVLTAIGIFFFFFLAISMTIILPNNIDPTWIKPSSHYQVQMYDVADPHTYIARAATGSQDLEYVNHLEEGVTLQAYQENGTARIIAPPELEKYITRIGDIKLKLTSRVLLLREPQISENFDAVAIASRRRGELRKQWLKDNPDWKEKGQQSVDYKIQELFDPGTPEAFALAQTEGVLENYIDTDFVLVDGPKQEWHNDPGVIFNLNPEEYRIRRFRFGDQDIYRYDPLGEPVKDLAELTGEELKFNSRQKLIRDGERYVAIEGCWYCHTDQSRTLIQDSVLNGNGTFAAPPSSANEYIYQKVTFPGTRRIGPDLSRTGVKRPSRDWHKSHFWEPRTESPGSIMPSFRYFFDDDPSGKAYTVIGVPNDRFEAIFQYLMTKGTRITPPTQAWWLGKDPIQTTMIIDGRDKIVPKSGEK